MKKVLVFGTFDGLHAGHIDFFKQAKQLGDHLTVVVARDGTVEKIKGHLAHCNEQERRAEVQKSELVDEARLGFENDPYLIIKEINPDVIAPGYDQSAFTQGLPAGLEKLELNPEICRMKPYNPGVCHSKILTQNDGGKNNCC